MGFVASLLVLSVNSLNLLFDKFHVVAELLYLAVHLFHQTVTLLAACVEEAEVVLISLNLLLELLKTANQTATLVVESILTTLGHVLKVVLEVVQATACS